MSEAISVLGRMSSYLIPLLMGGIGLLMLAGKRSYFDAFLVGATDGLKTAVRLVPTLVMLLVAVGMLRASGALNVIGGLLAPVCSVLGVPEELLPLLLTRPFSGSAATATYSSLLREVGANSFAAQCASVIMGSSDTAVYVITLYFSSVGVKRTRYALPVSLLLMAFCVFFSCFLCRVCLNAA